MRNFNVGIVADWFITYAGSEKVVAEFIKVFPDSELYSVVDFLSKKIKNIFRIKTSQQLLFRTYQKLKINIKAIYH